jgi:uncharacterized protein (DUF849 family)
VILQIGGRTLPELEFIVRHFSSLCPDIVSIPVSLFSEENAIALLRSRSDALRELRTRIVLDAEDLSMVFRAVQIQHDGLLDGRLRMHFCFGRQSGLPSDRDAFRFFVETLRRLAPETTWAGIGHGHSELELARWSVETGGHCKVTSTVGRSAADHEDPGATLSRIARLCKEYGRRPASFAEARHILSLDQAREKHVA